jgi:hypothetical protein
VRLTRRVVARWRPAVAVLAAAALGVFGATVAPADQPTRGDGASSRDGEVLGRELHRLEAKVRGLAATTGERGERTLAALERALDAYRQERRNLALQRLVPVFADFHTAEYLRQVGNAELATEWDGQRGALGVALDPRAGAATLANVTPAAVRATGEAALYQARAYHSASLPYGRATEPQSGFYYLGNALAHKALLDLVLALDEPATGAPPPVRLLTADVAALEAEMLALYRPPAATDHHGEFITASATLKEARELAEAGLHHGALLRYLQAAFQLTAVRDLAVPPLETVRAAVAEQSKRLAAGEVDHSIGRIFLESAEGDLAAATADRPPAVAAAMVADVLPRYFAALEPARPETRPAPPPLATQVAVTVVRWPYT